MKGYHMVRPGDSLPAIARRYGMTTSQVIKANRDLWIKHSPNILYCGEMIRVFVETEYDRCRRLWEETGELEWLLAMVNSMEEIV